MSHAAPALTMTALQRETLDRVARSHTAPHREVVRAKALLAAADGAANTRIAAELGVTAISVREWRARFEAEGLTQWGKVRQGRGRKPTISAAKIAEIVDLTLHHVPEGHTHWSCRTMAEHVGVSPATVQRIWDARGLKPHRVETDTKGLIADLDLSKRGSPLTREVYIATPDGDVEGRLKQVTPVFVSDEAKAYKAPHEGS